MAAERSILGKDRGRVRLVFLAVIALFVVQYVGVPITFETFPGWKGPGFALPSLERATPSNFSRYRRDLVLDVTFSSGEVRRVRPMEILERPGRGAWLDRIVLTAALREAEVGETGMVGWLQAGLVRTFPSRTVSAMEVVERTAQGEVPQRA
jgi:hypothetical protein